MKNIEQEKLISAIEETRSEDEMRTLIKSGIESLAKHQLAEILAIICSGSK
jgi:hypothetical protein